MANVIYNNFILENKYNSVLSTKLDFMDFLTTDYSLTESTGATKKIVTRTASGSVEDLAMGEGNTETIEVGASTTDYTVGTTQGRFVYFDEEAMGDDKVVESGLTGMSEKMVNNFLAKAVAEWKKTTLSQTYAKDGEITFNTVVDAIAKMELEEESGLFMLIGPDMVASFRKSLADNLKYSEGFARTGYIGSVCGVKVYVRKFIPAGEAIIATKEAVTNFIKKDTEIEQDRDKNLRKNTVYARKVGVVALTDATKVVKISEALA